MKQQNTSTPPTPVKEEGYTKGDYFNKIDVSEFSKSLDQKWREEITREGKHEIISAFRLQLLYSERLRVQNNALLSANKELIEALTPFLNLANEVFVDTRKNSKGVFYGFNKAEITFDDLRKVQEAIQKHAK